MQIIDTIRAWITAHPYVTAYAAIAVVSIALRIAGSTWWAGMKLRHPKLAGLLEVARAIGFDFPKLAQGILRIAYAMLPPPVGGGDAKPKSPPTIPPVLGVMMLATGLALPGCAFFQKHEAQIGKAERDILTCVMLHAASGQSVEEIAIACAGVTATDVAEILLSQKRAGYVLQKPGAAPCASGSAK